MVLWCDVIFNLNLGYVLMWLCCGVEVVGFMWLYVYVSLYWVDGWYLIVGWAFVFIVWDFGFYWLYCIYYKLGFLWVIYVVYYEGEYFNLLLGVCNVWLLLLILLLFFVLLVLLGVMLEMFVVVLGLYYLV